MEPIIDAQPLPLCFAAPVNWYAEALAMPRLKIADEQNFDKQTLRSRLQYGTFQGPRLFSIPLVNHTAGGLFRDVIISYAENWPNKLIHALQTAYGKSPFFEFYGYRFEQIILQKSESLWDLNMDLLRETLHCLRYPDEPEIIKSESTTYTPNPLNIKYYQVFGERISFMPGLSILDLLYNEGPDASEILLCTNKKIPDDE